jgi:IclR family KDG regulon transcriptional repressor
MSTKISKSGSVEKALTILECFDIKNPYLTLDQLSNKTGFPRATVFRMICSLEKFGYIRRKETTGEMLFSLGMVFLEKEHIVSTQLDIREISRPYMLQIRNETGLSVQLAVRDGDEAVYIDHVESLNAIRFDPQIRFRAPLYAGSAPRVMLAYLPEKEIDEILDRTVIVAFTDRTKVDRRAIKEDLKFIKENGYSISRGELLKGTMAIAAPVFNINGHVTACLSIIGLDSDFKEDLLDGMIQSLIKHSRAVSSQLK